MRKDLLLLVADKNMQFALKGALEQYQRLGIRPVEFETVVHQNRDGGVRTQGPQLLALRRSSFAHALLVLDYEGSGTKRDSSLALEQELDQRLQETWGADAKAIVIEPELDVWMWGSDNAIRQGFGRERPESPREWLKAAGVRFNENNKPERPKEALEMLLRLPPTLPRSSALYYKIATRISLQHCSDPAFQRLRSRLIEWFPLA